MLSHSGPCGSAMGMEAAELAVAEAKEIGEDAESSGPSRQPIQAFGWGLHGDVQDDQGRCQI